MSFRAEPAKMRRAATELGASADDAARFRTYADRYSDVAEAGIGPVRRRGAHVGDGYVTATGWAGSVSLTHWLKPIDRGTDRPQPAG